jgi:transmembrane sensor
MTAGGLRWNRPGTAAEWFAARRAPVDARAEQQFQEWLAEAPSRAEEYALCEILWEVSGEAAAELGTPDRVRPRSRRRAWSVAAVAASLAVAALATWFWPTLPQSFATEPGEQRTIVLGDGSRVTLNTRTRILVTLGRSSRDVVLDAGEAFFVVAKDPDRPFLVRTRLGAARAVGTHFDVYLDDERLTVTTEEGKVLVGSAAGDGVLVAAGRRADLRSGMSQATVGAADVGAALNWLNQRLEVNNVPLADVLRDFSRYTALPIRAATPSIAALRVSAVLRTGDIEALEATLKGALGLDVERHGGELVVAPGATPPPKPPRAVEGSR